MSMTPEQVRTSDSDDVDTNDLRKHVASVGTRIEAVGAYVKSFSYGCEPMRRDGITVRSRVMYEWPSTKRIRSFDVLYTASTDEWEFELLGTVQPGSIAYTPVSYREIPKEAPKCHACGK